MLISCKKLLMCPSTHNFYNDGSVAQLVEQVPLKHKVLGSNPSRPTIPPQAGDFSKAPVAQRIERWSSEPVMGVRFPPGAPEITSV